MADRKIEGIGRRDFLAIGPAFAISSGVICSAGAASARPLDWIGAKTGADGPSVSIGYWRGSDTLGDLASLRHACGRSSIDGLDVSADGRACDEFVSADVIGAEDLGQGDRSFARDGAEVSIHGMFKAGGVGNRVPPPLSIDAYFEPHHSAPFHAWRYDATGSPSSNTTFFAPVTADTGLTLGFTIGDCVEDASLGPARSPAQVLTQFTLGHAPGKPKLRRGVYFIAWRDEKAPSLPSWKWYHILADRPEDQERRPHERHLSRLVGRWHGFAPSDLAYVMVSIDRPAKQLG